METFQPDFGKAHKMYQYSKRNVPKDFKESYKLEKISILTTVTLQQCTFSDCYTVAVSIPRLLHYNSVHSQTTKSGSVSPERTKNMHHHYQSQRKDPKVLNLFLHREKNHIKQPEQSYSCYDVKLQQQEGHLSNVRWH